MRLKPRGSNRTEIEFSDGTAVFFSYATPVAAFVPGRGYLRTEEYYSRTTSRHVNEWLEDYRAVDVPQAELDELVKGA